MRCADLELYNHSEMHNHLARDLSTIKMAAVVHTDNEWSEAPWLAVHVWYSIAANLRFRAGWLHEEAGAS